MTFSKLCVLVVATLAAFAAASPTNLGESKVSCPVGVPMCCTQETGNYKNRALAINKLGALVARGITTSTPVWVRCSQASSPDEHHSLSCVPICCKHTASDLSVAIDCANG